MAYVSVWDRLMDQWSKPWSAATVLALLWRTSSGLPRLSPITSMSVQLKSPIPVPKALATASLTAKRPASLAAFPWQNLTSCVVKNRLKNFYHSCRFWFWVQILGLDFGIGFWDRILGWKNAPFTASKIAAQQWTKRLHKWKPFGTTNQHWGTGIRAQQKRPQNAQPSAIIQKRYWTAENKQGTIEAHITWSWTP